MSGTLPAAKRAAMEQHLELDLQCKLVTGDLFLEMVIEHDIGTYEWHWRFSNGKKVVTTGGAAFFNDFSATRMLARHLAGEYEPSAPTVFFNERDIRGGTRKSD